MRRSSEGNSGQGFQLGVKGYGWKGCLNALGKQSTSQTHLYYFFKKMYHEHSKNLGWCLSDRHLFSRKGCYNISACKTQYANMINNYVNETLKILPHSSDSCHCQFHGCSVSSKLYGANTS